MTRNLRKKPVPDALGASTRRRASRPVDKRNPTPAQLNRIVSAQLRRAIVDASERRLRRASLRFRNGQLTVMTAMRKAASRG